MKSTFKVLFYVKKQSVKNGKAPVMGRITINGTQAGFSCKKEVSLALWDVKTNRSCLTASSEGATPFFITIPSRANRCWCPVALTICRKASCI